MGATINQWQFPANEPGKVVGWSDSGRELVNRDVEADLTNADGGYTIATTPTPSVNIGGAFSGTWKTSNRFYSEETGQANTGTYATLTVMREAEGLASAGAGNSNVALFVESKKTDWLTSTAEGQTVGQYIVTRHGRRSDGGGGILIDQKRVHDGSYSGGMLGIEIASSIVNESNVTQRSNQVWVSWNMGPSSADPFTDGNIGFGSEPTVGNGSSTFMAMERSDLSTGWTWLFSAHASRQNTSQYAGITGNAHADGKGRLRFVAGSTAFPTYSFYGDTDTGMHNGGANVIAFSVGGANIVNVNSTGMNLVSGMALFNNSNQVVGSRKTGWTAATGTATRSTFATGSVTTAQLAERVKALLDDLISHGLIGA